jgi:tetratricopeptide (TPR) repeat protein
VARLGIQAAEALEHAHQLGVVYRDVKPGNLMLDGRGNLWVTDFGLARLPNDTGLTMTGDLIGTLRYMSPEQALAKRVVIDHRTDVYSLGATLYELLALRPVFDGNDRQELLRQIAFEEPRALRRWNKAIPAELVTIVLKALEKNPADRYAAANELADDLRRFLEDKPIRSKPATWRQRLVKWGRRHPAIVWAAVVVLAVTVPVLVASSAWAWHMNAQTAAALREAYENAQKAREAATEAQKEKERAKDSAAKATTQRKQAEANLLKALGLAEKYSAIARRNVIRSLPDLELATDLAREEASLWDIVVPYYPRNKKHALARQESYLVLSELLLQAGQFEEAAKFERPAVDFMEKWRTDVSGDRMFLEFTRMVRVYSYQELGDILRSTGEYTDALGAYGRALALFEEEIRWHEKSMTEDPWGTLSKFLTDRANIYNSLGALHLEAGQPRKAKKAYAQALALLQGPRPKRLSHSWPLDQAWQLSRTHNGLGEVLLATGARKEAAEEFRRAFDLLERIVQRRFLLSSEKAEQRFAWFLVACPIEELQDPKRAIELARQNIQRLSPSSPLQMVRVWWRTLAVAQYRTGDWKAALQSLRFEPHRKIWDGRVGFLWAMIHWQRDWKKGAREYYDETVRWMAKNKPRDVELRRFRAEAAALLGIKRPPPGKKEPLAK